jgi:hypothetical protein
MNNDHLKKQWDHARSVPELMSLARDLGNALPTASINQLNDFILQAAPSRNEAAPYASGVRNALVELTHAFELVAADMKEEREAQRIAADNRWRPVLEALAEKPMKSRALANQLGEEAGLVHKILSQMRGTGLVDALPGKSHLLTPRGERVLEKLKEDEREAQALLEPQPLRAYTPPGR